MRPMAMPSTSGGASRSPVAIAHAEHALDPLDGDQAADEAPTIVFPPKNWYGCLQWAASVNGSSKADRTRLPMKPPAMAAAITYHRERESIASPNRRR